MNKICNVAMNFIKQNILIDHQTEKKCGSNIKELHEQFNYIIRHEEHLVKIKNLVDICTALI